MKTDECPRCKSGCALAITRSSDGVEMRCWMCGEITYMKKREPPARAFRRQRVDREKADETI